MVIHNGSPAVETLHKFVSVLTRGYEAVKAQAGQYKKEIADDPEITAELKQCADVIAQTDEKMLAIRKKIEARGVAVRRD